MISFYVCFFEQTFKIHSFDIFAKTKEKKNNNKMTQDPKQLNDATVTEEQNTGEVEPSVVNLLVELSSRVEKIVKESAVAIRTKEKTLSQLTAESSQAVEDLERLKQKSESELKRLSDALNTFKESLPKL